jgi:HAD superfamily hydrolase (TIGR01493 family)
MNHRLFLVLRTALVTAAAASVARAQPADRAVPLYDNLGGHHYAISTRVPLAQRYFDQGLRLYYAFNHAEAVRAFAEGARLDPRCAVCHWGVALSYGPNINLPMDSAAGAAAYAAERLMGAYLALRPWPDAPAALRALRESGVRLGVLSNFTPAMLDAGIRGSGLEGVFEHVLSTDRARAFKPDPRAYRLGLDAFGLPREQVAFAAFAGWDAAGAKRFGYPTYWVNRLQAPPEELGVVPDGVGPSLVGLVAFVAAAR